MDGEMGCSFEDIVPNCKIPGDLMLNILTNLPVKSLLRFKAVSKPWCSLISSPAFVKLHLRRQSVVANSLLVSSATDCFYGLLSCIDEKKNTCVDSDVLILETSPIFDACPLSSKSKFMVIGSCNGLVCLCCLDPFGELTLWNPATRKCRRIQLPDGNFRDSICSLGLYYVEATNDFKIVGWADIDIRFKPSLFVYSSSSDSWKKWDWDCGGENFLVPYGFPTLISGCMNWMSRTLSASHVIASFDVADGSMSFFGVPDDCDPRTNILRPTLAIRGCLSIVVFLDFDDTERGLVFWVMEKYGDEESWIKRFTIRESRKMLYPFTSWNEGEFVVAGTNDVPRVLTFYELFNNKKYFLEFKSLRISQVTSYVESLASVGTEKKKVQADANELSEELSLELRRNCKLM